MMDESTAELVKEVIEKLEALSKSENLVPADSNSLGYVLGLLSGLKREYDFAAGRRDGLANFKANRKNPLPGLKVS